MEQQEYRDWLKSLKVGDRVALYYSKFTGIDYSIDTISKITPTGIFKVKNSQNAYNPNGDIKTSEVWHARERLVPITKEVIDFINMRNMKKTQY